MAEPSFRHSETLRVRWAEVDAQQIVFNGHYLMYVDTAVAGWWRALAVPYPQAVLALGVDLYVRKAMLEYEAAARYDDRLRVGMRCAHIGRSSLRFDTAIFRGSQRLVQGEVVYVCADPTTMRSQPVPDVLRNAVEAFESGQPMVRLQHADHADHADRAGSDPAPRAVQAARAVRAQCPDAADADLGHLGERGVVAAETVAGAIDTAAFNLLQQPVACGRLEWAPGAAAGGWRISGLLTVPVLRGGGHGAAVLQALLDAARSRNATAIVQAEVPRQALSLFERAGFVSDGAPGSGGRMPMQKLP